MSEHPVETILQYQFSNRDLLQEAIVTEAALRTAKNPKGGGQGSRRLALLGDSVLRECILEAWFQTKERVEGGSDAVAVLASNKRLCEVAHASGLAKHVVNTPDQQGPVSQETAASTVEALVAAVYLDSGKDLETVRKMLKAINLC